MATVYNKWRLIIPEENLVNSIAERVQIPRIIASVLVQRGLKCESEVQDFLYPQLNMLPPPNLMMGMEEAVQLIYEARVKSRQVVVFGDYDVDGVTSTALLVSFLCEIGVKVQYFHPDRLDDGYGLNENFVQKLSDEYPGCLLITVDCGISDHEAVFLAQQKGVSVIVTDHHLPPERLPEADAVINPLQSKCEFPCKDLAGVGIAFYLIIGVRAKLREEGVWSSETQPNLKRQLDLVAIGSVADMVPLLGVNRVLVKAGLDFINQEKDYRRGVQSLLSVSGLTGKEINSEDIGYQVGPRINAAGRIASASLATDLLVCGDLDQANKMGLKLNLINEERKKMVEALTEVVMEKAEEQVGQGRNVLVLHGEDWHHGIIGIIASRVCEMYMKPTIILGGGAVAKGSARTIPGVDIYQALKSCKDYLVQFGGHKQAAGLTIETRVIPEFRSCLDEVVKKYGVEGGASELVLDGLLGSNEKKESFFDSYKLLTPFGIGNAEPKFSLTDACYLRNVRVIGKKKNHLRFSVKICNKWLSGIGFGFGYLADVLVEHKANIAFSFRENWFRGRKTMQVFLHDVEVITG